MKTGILAAGAVAAFAAFAANPVAATSEVCGEIDILWIMDESGSVSHAEYQTMKNFVASSADPFILGPVNTRMSVIEFATNYPGDFYLWDNFGSDTQENKWDFKNHTLALHRQGGLTNMAGALTWARDYLEPMGAGAARPDTEQIVVLLTDGNPTTGGSPTGVAQELVAAGVTLIYIPIGGNVNQNLFDGYIPSEHVFPANDFDALDGLLVEIIANVECFTPAPECIGDTNWDMYNSNLNVAGNVVSNPSKTKWRNAIELDSHVGSPPCCLRYVADIFEDEKGMAFVGLTAEMDASNFAFSGHLGRAINVYGADSRSDFYANMDYTTSQNAEGQENGDGHVDQTRDQIEIIYCPGDATITVTTFYQGVPKNFRTFTNVPAGDYHLVTSLINDQGAGPMETTTVTLSVAECINCDIQRICIPEWDCRTGGMDIYDSINAGISSNRDGIEFTKRGWAELWRNAVGIEQAVFPGEIVELVFTLDFLKSKGDFMVGINPDCDQSKIAQGKNSPLSIMYWGSGWIYVGGSQHTRIDWQTFYPREGDEIKAKIDLVAGTIVFELNSISAGVGFQPMHAPINIPIRSYYAAASIYYVNAKIGLRCPE